MRYTIGTKKVDTKKTQIKLQSKAVADHEVMQHIEKYMKAMYGNNLDMSKLHFYAGSSEDKKAEVSADKAIDQLNFGYPLIVKHDDVKGTVPFLKRVDEITNRATIYTGSDILKQEKHPEIEIGFDIEKFRKTPAPEKPGIWESIKAVFGHPTERYTAYQSYKEKLDFVKKNDYFLKKYESELEGYKRAGEIKENPDLEDVIYDIENPAKKAEVKEEAKVEVEAEKQQEAPAVEENYEEMGNLNINDFLQSNGIDTTEKKFEYKKNSPAPEKKYVKPSLSRAQLRELDERTLHADEVRKYVNSSYMKTVIKEIKGLDFNNKKEYDKVYNKLNSLRRKENVPKKFTTKELMDFAREYENTEVLLNKASKSMKKFEDNKLTQKELAERQQLKNKIAKAIAKQLSKTDKIHSEETLRKIVLQSSVMKKMSETKEKLLYLAQAADKNPKTLTQAYINKLNEYDKQQAKKQNAEVKNTDAVKAEPKVEPAVKVVSKPEVIEMAPGLTA